MVLLMTRAMETFAFDGLLFYSDDGTDATASYTMMLGA